MEPIKKMEIIKRKSDIYTYSNSKYVEDDLNSVLSNAESQEGNTNQYDFLRNILDSVGSTTAVPLVKKSNGGQGLLNTLKNNSNTVSESLHDVVKVMHESNMVQSKNVTAIENMGNNITNALSVVTAIMNIGNLYKDVNNKVINHHGNVQSQKNFMQIDNMEFEAKEHLDLVDSKGNPIIPRRAKALNNAETAEHVTYLKKGDESQTDTDGKVIIPRNATATKDAEKAIETKEMNESTITEELGFLDEFFMGLDSAVEDVTDDYLSDGFNFSVNPFENFFKILENDLDDEMNKIEQGA